jgi:hypothetical protein
LHLSTAYHPQTNGKTEVVNKCLENYLWCSASKRQSQWAQWLPLTGWWYKTSYNTSTHMTPFEAVYEKKKPLILAYMSSVSKVEEVEKNLTICMTILHTLKENLFLAQNHMNQQEEGLHLVDQYLIMFIHKGVFKL